MKCNNKILSDTAKALGWQWSLELKKWVALLMKKRLEVELKPCIDVINDWLRRASCLSVRKNWEVDSILENRKSRVNFVSQMVSLLMATTNFRPYERRSVCSKFIRVLNEVSTVVAKENFVKKNRFLNGLRGISTLDIFRMLHFLRLLASGFI